MVLCAPTGPWNSNSAHVFFPEANEDRCTADQGYGDIGCYGAKKVKTPNLDKFAGEGSRFTDAHATSATLYAEPPRAVDGRIPVAEERVGKWHLGLGEGKIDWNGDKSYLLCATRFV